MLRNYYNNALAPRRSSKRVGICPAILAYVGGELYVTGRKNDLIILAGRNFYPQELKILQLHRRV